MKGNTEHSPALRIEIHQNPVQPAGCEHAGGIHCRLEPNVDWSLIEDYLCFRIGLSELQRKGGTREVGAGLNDVSLISRITTESTNAVLSKDLVEIVSLPWLALVLVLCL